MLESGLDCGVLRSRIRAIDALKSCIAITDSHPFTLITGFPINGIHIPKIFPFPQNIYELPKTFIIRARSYYENCLTEEQRFAKSKNWVCGYCPPAIL